MMKVILALFLLQAFVWQPPFAAAQAQDNTRQKIKIGVSTALTGEASTWGVDIQSVLRFADEKLGKGRYEFIFEDDKGSAKDAVTVAQKFVSLDKVKYAAGFASSSTILPSAGIYERAKVVTMVVSASSPKISELGDYVFRTFPSDAYAAKRLYDHIAAKRPKNLAIISLQSDYAQDFKDAFVRYAQADALPVFSEDYLPGTSLKTP